MPIAEQGCLEAQLSLEVRKTGSGPSLDADIGLLVSKRAVEAVRVRREVERAGGGLRWHPRVTKRGKHRLSHLGLKNQFQQRGVSFRCANSPVYGPIVEMNIP